MHLKSLTLKGFKSFASATTLKFEPGICAVVGPNGSGKSNVVDALAWVMGEQGAKSLRGSTMQDVIFAGAGSRGPLGRAEVTLTIDNHDGRLPIEYAEVSVTRRMFRDGASEYEINGSKARLMDVRELLSDTGIGREMHIIVGQGKLAEILAARPEERRAYIEEAAGVLKHRRRKEKAQRKLAGMQANLDRLHDLTEELRRQLGPLARQAETARRAATVQAEVREARLVLGGYQVATARAEAAAAEGQRRQAAQVLSGAREGLERAAAEKRRAHEAVEVAEPAFTDAQQLWFQLSTLLERVRATLRVASERANADAPLDETVQGPDSDELDRQADEADRRYEQLAQQAAEADARLEAIAEEVDRAAEAFNAAEAEHLARVRAVAEAREGVARLLATRDADEARVAELDEHIEAADHRMAEARERAAVSAAELERAQGERQRQDGEREPLEQAAADATKERDAAEARLESLRAAERERSGAVYALEARIETLASAAPGNDSGAQLEGARPLAELLHPAEGAAEALAAALGRHGSAVVAALAEPEWQGLTGTADLARTTVLVEGARGSWRMDAELPDGASWLLDHIEVDPAVSAAVNRLLADVVLVPDPEHARRLVAVDPRLRAVTRGGELFGECWAEVGKKAPGPVEITSRIAAAEAELCQAKSRLEELSGMVEGARLTAEEARVVAASATAHVRDFDAEIARRAAQLEATAKRAADDEKAAAKARADLERAHERALQARRQLEATTRLLDDRQDEPAGEEPTTEDRDAARANLDQAQAMHVEARLALRSAEERAEQFAGRGDKLRRQASAGRELRERRRRAAERRRRRLELAGAVAHEAERVLGRVETATEVAAGWRTEAERERGAAAAELARAEKEETQCRAACATAQQRAHTAELALSQRRVRVEEAERSVTEELRISLPELMDNYQPAADFDVAAWRKRLANAERALSALGKVNPLALEEYKALEERYTFLSTQLADVEAARDDLHGVIEDVDEQILSLFIEAWKDVQAEFPRVFSTLFPGGTGRLELTDPDDMLTTGIELSARPPGKKVGRLSLLSGGEKSLTALALLVAIFRARPSPFYVLDEVEAALDDVNLRRLINLLEELREDSQLIVITHQKATMDTANVLYGVTMRDDGVTRVISQRMRPVGQSDVD
ncbi:chromosome segregation protein SMC [Corynebacterium atypicum]|uniref:Chromosome partition protein Smc n=1 Tax=Corynebacterium atypicum TaxID=191610 RepID=A0ABN4DCF9_9CORY|nr:chromosome segregation protein SMC [Corynebacterium atypicum]AIG63935.1 chromosome segregation protein SMC [Corynebacterium atypicum]